MTPVSRKLVSELITGPEPDLRVMYALSLCPILIRSRCLHISSFFLLPLFLTIVNWALFRFAPLDLEGTRGLRPLFFHYRIPSDFLTERVHGVPQSNGARTFDDGSHGNMDHHLETILNKADVHFQPPGFIIYVKRLMCSQTPTFIPIWNTCVSLTTIQTIKWLHFRILIGHGSGLDSS